MLTAAALEKLLARFSPDRDEAVQRYEAMRVKLTRYFEWRLGYTPDDHVDEAFNRVTRRIDEGEDIFNLNSYFYSVAYRVFLETLKKREEQLDSDRPPPIPVKPPDEEKEARLRCLDKCLNEFASDRQLILTYYEGEKRAKIDLRKKLADERKISLDALRIRACRLRKRLEECTKECLKQFD